MKISSKLEILNQQLYGLFTIALRLTVVVGKMSTFTETPTCVSLLTFYIAMSQFENNDVLEFLTSFSYIKIGKFKLYLVYAKCVGITFKVKSAVENFNDCMMRRKTGEEKYHRFKCMTLAL
ncbi:conserved hypothetical protein [Trichinella spiralis]|uniref:hypothetical protein n=1 Tax=Trichinella spiralis TaxID=6334 RepID=UPI0001EFE00E|nr:conserved hypothetical protein [Trichinella spiralis]